MAQTSRYYTEQGPPSPCQQMIARYELMFDTRACNHIVDARRLRTQLNQPGRLHLQGADKVGAS
jgi:hypothetical protein